MKPVARSYIAGKRQRQISDSPLCDSLARAVDSEERGEITGRASKSAKSAGLDEAQRTRREC